MPSGIHTLMQDSHDDDSVFAHDIEEQVGADPVAAVPRTNLVRGSPSSGVLRDALSRGVELENVGFRLCRVPALLGEVPDLREVVTCGGREEQSAQRFLPATKESMSSTSSEVIRAGLRLLEDHESQMRALRSALVAGEESGAPEVLDIDSFVAGKKR